ncbi:MFS transporter [uncultured Dubosiella sp.]|uniref:MFS transporter n=2 Tax=uncultured Dubosiella sp. TaxID=1937011 RepID=UPI0025D1710B|nr:MFS transporter [uncultured Dubosiella sp.]
MNNTNNKLSYESFSNKQRTLVTIGCLGLIFSTGAYGLSLATIQGPLLRSIGAESAFSLVAIIGALAMCIMTPIGGRLCDIFGIRKVVLVGGIIAIISGLIFPFAKNLPLFIACYFFLYLAEGAFITSPYIMANIINKPKDVPKMMGLISAMLGLSSFLGSYLAGVLTDHNMMTLAILFPIIGLLVGVPCIALNYPSQERSTSVKLDIPGIILLVLTLAGILLGLNFGPAAGWSHPIVITCFIVGILSLFVLIWYEKKPESPLIPLRMFKNKQYTMLLVITFLVVFYMSAVSTYVPRSVQDILQQSVTVSGTITIPRTIITVLLPSFVGVWLSKNLAKNTVISLVIAGLCIGIAFTGLIYVGPHMPVWFIIVMVGLTGIADAFRSVCITPEAQTLLAPKDMGIGTSFIGFVISLSNVVSATVDGIAYDTLRLSVPGIPGITEGVDTVFLIAAVTGFATFLITWLVYSNMSKKRLKKLAEEKAQ